MTSGIDWQQERAKAGNHTQRTLVELAERAGLSVLAARGRAAITS